MPMLDDVVAAFNNLLKADAELGNYIGMYTWSDNSQMRAIFFGVAPPGVIGCYAVIRVEENPDEDPGRKRLWYAVDIFDDSSSAIRAIKACKRIERIFKDASPSLVEGHFLRVWLDTGPLQVPEETGQHWSMDFVIEYSENQMI